MWEVGRAPERRLEDGRRAAHTTLSKQMTTGNYPVDRYLDSEGNWKEGADMQFVKDNAVALGVELDEKGEIALDEEDNMNYSGRGARHGQQGLLQELETFKNLMQRSGTFDRQREMRGTAQNMASPTLGPQMYAESMDQASSLQEKLEIANRFGDANMANQISQQLTEQAAIAAAAAGAEPPEETSAIGEMGKLNTQVQGAIARGDTSGAYNMLIMADTDPMAAGKMIGSALVKQRGGKFTPDLLQDAGMVQFMDVVFDKLGGGTALKESGGMNNWPFWADAKGQARSFTDRVLQMLGAQADPEMREAIYQWWHTRNESSQYAGHYTDGQASGDNSLPTTPEQEAPPEEDLDAPPGPPGGTPPPPAPQAPPGDLVLPNPGKLPKPPKKQPPKKDSSKPGTRGRRPFDKGKPNKKKTDK
jgi:hypothetical protein